MIAISNGTFTLYNSIIYGNNGMGIFSNFGGDITVENILADEWVLGSPEYWLDEDPLFVDPDQQDFHLEMGSPAIDYGAEEFIPSYVEYDLDGAARVLGSFPDLGCYEIIQPIDCPGDFDGNNIVNTSDLLIMLQDFGCTSGCIADMNEDGVVNIPDLLVWLSLAGTNCN
jgi:hypothetical protein